MASTAKLNSVSDRTGRRPKEEVGVVELDSTFGRMLGLVDGQKVRTIGRLRLRILRSSCR